MIRGHAAAMRLKDSSESEHARMVKLVACGNCAMLLMASSVQLEP